MKFCIQMLHPLAFACLCAAISLPLPEASMSSVNVSSTWPNTGPTHNRISPPETLPYSIRVPNSQYWLHLGFDDPTQTLPSYFIRSILLLAQESVTDHIEEEGEDALVRKEASQNYRQVLEMVQPYSIFFVMRSHLHSDQIFTWGFVRDVLNGLWRFLVERRRFLNTRFRVSTAQSLGSTIAAGLVEAEYPSVEIS